MNFSAQRTRSAGRNRLPIGAALLDVGVIAGWVLAVVPVLGRMRFAVAGGAVIGVPVVVTVIIVRSVPSRSAAPRAVEPAALPKAVTAAEMRAMEAAAEAPAVTAAAPAAMRGFCRDWLGQCQNARERYDGNTQAACDADRFHAAYSSRSLPEWQLVRGDLGPDYAVRPCPKMKSRLIGAGFSRAVPRR